MALDYSALGKRISNFRNASGFTQEQFCEKLNMSRKHISQIEAATSRPSLEALVDIANLLGISADDLLVQSDTLGFHCRFRDSPYAFGLQHT